MNRGLRSQALNALLHHYFASASVNYVTPCSVGVVCRLFLLSGVMMFGGLPVRAGGVRQVF
jgi:hypothetical protein